MNELSLDYINAKSPYLVKRADDGDYVFQTAKGVIYGIGFIENDPLGGCETYQLSISNQNKLHASYDPDVKNTTLIIVDAFFRENLDGLLYMCDTSDSREAARNRLFLRWFEESAEPERFSIKTVTDQPPLTKLNKYSLCARPWSLASMQEFIPVITVLG